MALWLIRSQLRPAKTGRYKFNDDVKCKTNLSACPVRGTRTDRYKSKTKNVEQDD
jgi:hypothetical protein